MLSGSVALSAYTLSRQQGALIFVIVIKEENVSAFPGYFKV